YVRVDFNVPLADDGTITDDTRLRAAVPTVQWLREHGAAVILAAHLGRPKGKAVAALSLQAVVAHLSELLGTPVQFATDCVGEEAKQKAAQLAAGEVLLLENVRFHAEETKNDPAFAKQLAELADLAVNDAFGVSHRAHASVVGVSEYLPMAAGLLLHEEIEHLDKAAKNPKRPFVAIIGGAKVSDKIGVIQRFVELADTVIIGGGMANTFLLAQGYEIGTSLVEKDKLDVAQAVIQAAAQHQTELLLPTDGVVAQEFSADATPTIVSVADVPGDQMILDAGPDTVAAYEAAIRDAATIVWNGPLGVFEFPAFAKGTQALARAVAQSNAYSIVGGGDSVAAVNQSGVADQISHISTGGGASLEYLEGKPLPGIACLAQEKEGIDA
ncbi:MAG: phosphoglycerate kinase, partial [Negativicoccus succinicivorans]|uniref:phosphoglycerate kinase n=1 Tax=Negativicoccus succinicivorans TaxID=620903 RepID=UPI00290814F3